MHNKIFVDRTERSLSQKGVNHQKNKTLPINAICVSCIGTAGLVCITSELSQTNQQINSVICKPNVSVYYTFFTLRSLGQQIKEWGDKGSVGVNMNKTEFSAMEIVKPLNKTMSDFENIITPIFNGAKVYQKELVVLKDILELINAKMSQEK
jgi:type I restriction enzyme S subunit